MGAALPLLLHERAILIGRTEINIDAPDPVALEDEELGIAETLSIPGCALIGHKVLIALHNNPFQLLLFDPVADLPARRISSVLLRGILGSLLRHHPEKRLGLPQDAHHRWLRLQAVEIARNVAVGAAERLAHRPAAVSDLHFDHRIRGAQLRPRGRSSWTNCARCISA